MDADEVMDQRDQQRELGRLRDLNAMMLRALKIAVAAPGSFEGNWYSQVAAREVARTTIVEAEASRVDS